MNAKLYLVCAVLLVITDFSLAGRKTSSSSRRGGSSSSSSSRISKPQQPHQYANPSIAQLSYGGNQPAQAISRPQLNSAPQPSAPVANSNANTRPIGWNVDSPAVVANKPPVHANPPYPVNNQPGLGQPMHPAAPPPYSPVAGQGPPPPYSQYPNPNVPNRFGEAPPAYSQGGFPQQPNYPQQPGLGPVSYPHPQAGYPQQPNYPQGGQYPQQNGFGGAPGGYPGSPGGGYPGAPGSFNQQPQVVNNYEQKGSGGSGLQTALLAGVGGLALYGALKPSDTKTIIINNTVVQTPENATLGANATMVEMITTPVPLASYPVGFNGSTDAILSIGSSEMVPLATVPPPAFIAPVSSEPLKLDPNASIPTTGLYPSLTSEVTMGSGIAIEVTTAVPLAQYPSSPSNLVDASQLSSSSQAPFALASLNSQSTPAPDNRSSSKESGAPINTFTTANMCLLLAVSTYISRLLLQ